MRTKERRNVQQKIVQALLRGLVIECVKTKSLAQGGKQHISLGPYKTATGAQGYTMICTGKHPKANDQIVYPLAVAAAQDYIGFVGRDIAWRSVNAAIRKAREDGVKGI